MLGGGLLVLGRIDGCFLIQSKIDAYCSTHIAAPCYLASVISSIVDHLIPSFAASLPGFVFHP